MPRLAAHARTHTGRRANNEDAFVCRPEAGLFAVVDGMGAQEAGEVAAAIVATTLAELPGQTGLAGETLLVGAFREARERVLAHGRANPRHAGMGAAATAVRLDDDGSAASIAHVGDTRAWHVREQEIVQLTRDHVGAREDGRPALARDLGRDDLPEPWVDTHRVALAPGDLLVLASDGLHDALGQEVLARTLRELHDARRSARSASRLLLHRALDAGAHDNVTVLVVRAGAWERGAARGWSAGRRLPRPLALAVFALVGVLAIAAVSRDDRRATVLTGPVDGTEERTPERLTLEGDVRVETGAVLTLRGTAVTNRGGRVVLAEGATLVLRRSVLDGDPLELTLGPDALLVIEDTSVLARVRVVSAGRPGGRVDLARVVLAGADTLTIGDGIARSSEGVMVRPAQGESAPSTPP
jgi:serine/threonine protein phosphatase PrpC